MNQSISFQGEFQFRRYSDTSTQGQQVVFAVADRESLESFIGKEGKRFMAVLVEVGDDEQPVQQQARPKDIRGPYCREACDLCKSPEFHAWLNGAHPDFIGAYDEHMAKNWLLAECEIVSRKELDSDPTAADLFIKRVRVPFMHWQRSAA